MGSPSYWTPLVLEAKPRLQNPVEVLYRQQPQERVKNCPGSIRKRSPIVRSIWHNLTLF